MQSIGSKIRFSAIVLAVFFLINLIVYGETLNHPFMMEDERLFGMWARPLNLDSILACLNPYQKLLIYYRPTANFLYLLLNHLSGGDPLVCRFYILVLFTIFIALLYFLTKELFKNNRIALIVAVIFLVHPINGFYVNYITASSVLIWGVMMTGALCAHLVYIKKESLHWLSLSIVLSFLALGSHEMAGILPVYILLLNRFLNVPWAKAIQRALCYALVVGIWHLPRMIFISHGENVSGMMASGAAGMGLDLWNYLPNLMFLIGWYLKQLIWPAQVLFMKTIWPIKEDLFFLNVFIGILFVSLAVILVRLRDSLSRGSVIWFIVGLMPLALAMFISPAQGLTVEPHWFMIGSFGFFWTAAFIFNALRNHTNFIVGGVCVAFVLGALVLLTKNNNALWRTERTYCSYWLSQEPRQQFPSFWMGLSSLKMGELKSADYFFRQALTGWYIDWETFINLGAIALRENRFNDSIMWNNKALALNPSAAEAYNNLGAVAWNQGDAVSAREFFKKAVAVDSFPSKAVENLKIISTQEQ